MLHKIFRTGVIIFCALLIGGCVATHYHGVVYGPTVEIALYYDKSDLPKDKYKPFGELEVVADTCCSSEAVIEKLEKEAKAKGADAALITWMDSSFEGDTKIEMQKMNDTVHPLKSDHKCGSGCSSECHHDHDPNPYKYKQIIKVLLLKDKNAEPYQACSSCNHAMCKLEREQSKKNLDISEGNSNKTAQKQQ
ncbi:MAG: hypothetical protein GY750_15020 [Lentisphaerae bacterium]|nr:hypothetical protein [Lentisphaerota bacterium]MCP4102711.1 hypothetical protein [Lentisphaerota bacterium]